jgi:hypothetical protein
MAGMPDCDRTGLGWAAPVAAGRAGQLSATPRIGVASGAPPAGALPIYLSLRVLCHCADAATGLHPAGAADRR